MMDNSQPISDNTVNSTESKPAETQVFEAKAPETTEVKEVKHEDKRVPLHELYKERNRRKAAEEELGKVNSRISELEAKYSKVSQSQDDDALVAEAEKELGIDKEAARKLLKLQRKVAESVAPKQQANQSMTDPVLVAMDGFKKRASEVSQDYEDWNQMIPAMQAIMGREIELNGLGAYNKSPEYYYSKALKAQRDSETRVKKEDAVDKENGSTMATSETGGSSKQSSGSKINQAIWDANKSDAKWVRENEAEVKQLWRQGKLK